MDPPPIPPTIRIQIVHGILPTDDVEGAFTIGEDGLVSAAEAEETLVEEIDGVVVDTTSIREQDLGRGK